MLVYILIMVLIVAVGILFDILFKELRHTQVALDLTIAAIEELQRNETLEG